MVDYKDLLKAGIHFGHKTSFGNPKMRPYIWGAKNRIHLIDVSKTAVLLDRAGKKLTEVVSKGGSILWIGTKRPAQAVIKKVGLELKMPHVINRWIGGTLSNYSQVKKAITRLLHLREVLIKSTSFHTKKEMVMLQKQVARLERNVGGIVDIDFPPAAIVVVDAKKEASAVKEAYGVSIPVIALVDTNTDPGCINYIIPGNDDSPKSIDFVVQYLASCAAEGQKIAETKKAEAKAAKEAKAEPAKKVAAPKAKEAEVKVKKAAPKAEEVKAEPAKKVAAPKAKVAEVKVKKAAPKAEDVKAEPTKKEAAAKKTVKKTAAKTTKKKTAAKK